MTAPSTETAPVTERDAKWTEAEVTAALRLRMTKSGNGGAGEYAFLPQVRNAAGFDATRTFDAMTLSLWPSRGMALSIYEIKVSLSDWRRELADPAKGEDACRIADQFWIAAPAGVVPVDEVPPTWGLTEVRRHGDGYRWTTPRTAPMMQGKARKALPRGLVVAMLRACPGAVPGGKNPSASERELAEARATAMKAGIEQGRASERASMQRENFDAGVLSAALIEAGMARFETTPERLAEHAEEIADLLARRRQLAPLHAARRQTETALKALDRALSESFTEGVTPHPLATPIARP